MSKRDLDKIEKLTTKLIKESLEDGGGKFYNKYFKDSKNITMTINQRLTLIWSNVMSANASLGYLKHCILKYIDENNIEENYSQEKREMICLYFMKIDEFAECLDTFNDKISKVLRMG